MINHKQWTDLSCIIFTRDQPNTWTWNKLSKEYDPELIAERILRYPANEFTGPHETDAWQIAKSFDMWCEPQNYHADLVDRWCARYPDEPPDAPAGRFYEELSNNKQGH